jgi:CDP-paratose 2-epimerase
MKILITGGAGFIGSNLANFFCPNHDVTVFDSLARPGSEKNALWLKSKFKSRIKIVKGEITDEKIVNKLVMEKEVIYHLAAQVAVTNSVTDPKTDFRVNLAGTFNVLEAARRNRHKPFIIYSSTNKVYGDIDSVRPKKLHNTPVDESTPLDFYSPYACSKGGADCYVHDYFRIYQIPTVVFRQSCIYGVRQYGSEDQGWVAHFIRLALKGKTINIYGDGRQMRDLLYIDDLVDLFERVTQNRNKVAGMIFNVGGGEKNAVNLLEVIHKIENILKQKVKYKFVDPRPGDQKFYVSDIKKVSRILNWRPKISVDNGLIKLVSWLVEN